MPKDGIEGPDPRKKQKYSPDQHPNLETVKYHVSEGKSFGLEVWEGARESGVV